MNPQVKDAIKLLGVYTAGSFDVWMLAGSSKATCRAHVMSALYGRKVPQREAGVTAMREAFHALAFNHDAPNFKAAECLAAREEAFTSWAATL